MTDIERIKNFYDSYLQIHPHGGGWPDPETAQSIYYTVVSSETIPWNRLGKILDIGSGNGSFLPYLRNQMNFHGAYHGIEILDYFWTASLQNFKNDRLADFSKGDFLTMNFQKEYDWSFAIGTFGTRQPNQSKYEENLVSSMKTASRIGFTIYLNDQRFMNADRLAAMPDLVAHDINHFQEILSSKWNFSKIDLVRHPNLETAQCAISITI